MLAYSLKTKYLKDFLKLTKIELNIRPPSLIVNNFVKIRFLLLTDLSRTLAYLEANCLSRYETNNTFSGGILINIKKK